MADTPFSDTIASLSTPTAIDREIDTVEDLLDALDAAAAEEKLIMFDVAWSGCSGCSNIDLGTAFGEIEVEYPNMMFKTLPWRDSDGYETPQKRPYILFTEIIRGHFQVCAAGRPVETYSEQPPWARPHFPQLIFIDGRQINTDRVSTIRYLAENDRLFNERDELLVYTSGGTMNRQLRDSVTGAIYHSGLLAQLLNENIFALSNIAFQHTAFLETVRCIVARFDGQPEPSDCVMYHRLQRE